ncbi:uncharacterized protein LOC106637316 [Copidosoma floridanum]|uniref:uncharacterized protein LOC106637316 n=1 Tax=Copidosoma floridanum TaxID=29053 RepID=UPI0006C9D8F9|nr:uncharacterized protein LOC106637316 [Copidosoma floridanum]XP_014205536.1 uncharacterized protein LOC106637316 [Copidosoma floridanum]
MGLEEPLLKGYLLLPPQGMLQQLKKSWYKKYCQIFKPSKYGIQRLEIYDSQEEALTQQHTQRIITLEACIKISLSSQPLTFTLVTKSGVHHFGCCSEVEVANWMSAFQSVAFKDDASSITVEEDNDLYCTSGEGVFTVKISETEASRKCGLEPLKNYTLIVGATEMKLMDTSLHVLYTWPYQYIRKYGYSEKKFTFEAGRRCGSGEGSFCLEHKNQLDIYRCFVSNKTKMKQMLSGGENSPTVDCSDAQFHAALSMEAGSRSPLPPSVNTSKNLIDLDISGFTQNNSNNNSQQKQLLLPSPISPTDPVKPPLPSKPKPVKPPRKPVFAVKPPISNFDSEYQPLVLDLSASNKYSSKQQQILASPTSPEVLPKGKSVIVTDDEKHPYDLVEVRSDAWRTHGLENVPHTERLKQSGKPAAVAPMDKDTHQEINEPRYQTLNFSSQNSSIKSNSPSIIHNIPSPNDPPDYDRLQHFGTVHKNKNNPGYRTPSIGSSSSSTAQLITSKDSSPVSVNNYDLVEDLNAIRLANDAHHGYGSIRKKSSSSSAGFGVVSSTNQMMHEPKYNVVNDSEYAIVSKPKRV